MRRQVHSKVYQFVGIGPAVDQFRHLLRRAGAFTTDMTGINQAIGASQEPVAEWDLFDFGSV